jgi:hypothetical protein
MKVLDEKEDEKGKTVYEDAEQLQLELLELESEGDKEEVHSDSEYSLFQN